MQAVQDYSPDNGIVPVCTALSLSRASYYRSLKPRNIGEKTRACSSPRALTEIERGKVLHLLHNKPFIDMAPAAIVATLLDEGTYVCSTRTMYRILEAENEVRERRNQRRHPNYKKPELLATAPNQVWSWDITKLKGPEKWTYFYLYVIMDIFSRYVVGWMVAFRENANLAARLIADTCQQQEIHPDQLSLHADRGSPMKAKCTAQLLADLGVTKSHSRPHVSNDNPYSEAQFKTMKYRPDFPGRFASQLQARGFSVGFFDWYNNKHKHSGLNMMTPYDVHHGLAEALLQGRRDVMKRAFENHPERFVKGSPILKDMPTAAWINPPKTNEAATPEIGEGSVTTKDSMIKSANIP